MKPSNTIIVSTKYIEEKEHQIADLSKKVERLQEQTKEANTVICGLYHLTTDKKAASGVVCDYLVKYGESGV